MKLPSYLDWPKYVGNMRVNLSYAESNEHRDITAESVQMIKGDMSTAIDPNKITITIAVDNEIAEMIKGKPPTFVIEQPFVVLVKNSFLYIEIQLV